jgi:hypothetical protein
MIPIKTKKSEPWVQLSTGQDFKNWKHEDEIAYNQALRQTEKYAFFIKTMDFLADNRILGDYHEYGSHRVRTFRMALTEARRKQALKDMKFFSFDSFEGLPQSTSNPSHPVWVKGALSTSEAKFKKLIKEHGISVDKVKTIKGFYQDSLTKKLQQQFIKNEAPIALACIDCDLYESAIHVFKFIEPLLQEGTILYLDDLFTGYKGSPTKGVSKAFTEHMKKSKFKYAEHLTIGWWGKSYICYR